MVLISLSAAIIISIPLGIASYKNKKIGKIILSVTGIIQTIPSLALLVFMIPLLGIGSGPAIFALFLYSLLPIVRNTFTGLEDIPSTLQESAIVLGLSSAAVCCKAISSISMIHSGRFECMQAAPALQTRQAAPGSSTASSAWKD